MSDEGCGMMLTKKALAANRQSILEVIVESQAKVLLTHPVIMAALDHKVMLTS